MNLNQITVLMAEDDSILRYAIARILSKLGYCVIEATDGTDALSKEAECDGEIHLLVTNVRMPKMGGHQLAREIKGRRPGIRILIVSGDHVDEFPPGALEDADALMKPVDPSLLVKKVQELLLQAR